MNPFPDPQNAPDLLHEADIGSGEKTPAERDTDAMIRSIPPLPEADGAAEGEDAAPPSELDEDIAAATHRHEQEDSLARDDPDDQLDALDPVPPEAY
ncbi:hypothetical protein [Massilia sp. TS11]|uniref:hypothetical protein n=1 Tax=Massilia sp. TS11 TaxID=2908003 RepID=UPI001EDC5EA2|nr:hypothetical protein [Massilia sp. TS11]MCG2584294.1 hypothetical protein [Massilia sp. TS11]